MSSDSLKDSCKDSFEGFIYKAIFVRTRLQGDFVIGSPNPYFYRCKFSVTYFRDLNFDFSENPRRILRGSEVGSRLPSPPIVETNCVRFTV